MTGFLKKLRGYVEIRVWGFSPERFINLCSNHGILIWGIKKNQTEYEMFMSLKDFYKIKTMARKTGVRVVVSKRYGLPFLLPKILGRKAFVVGFGICILFWILSENFLWNIRYYGNYMVTEDQLNTFLEQQNVRIGMRKELLNIADIEKELRKEFPQIAWVSITLSGTYMNLEIKENSITKREDEMNDRGMDLVSHSDGSVVSMIVRSGIPLVKKGDIVQTGQVLIDGKVPIYNEDGSIKKFHFVEADGDILIESVQHFEEEIPCYYTEQCYTGRTYERNYVKFGNKSLGIAHKEKFFAYDRIQKESRPLLFVKLNIPIFLGREIDREYQTVEKEYTQGEATTLLKAKIEDFEKTLREKGVQIMKKNVKIVNEYCKWKVYAQFIIRDYAKDLNATQIKEEIISDE